MLAPRLPAAVLAALCLLFVACGDDAPSAAERESAAEAERARKEAEKDLEDARAELEAARKALEEAEKALDDAPTPEEEAKAKSELDAAKKQLDDAKKELEGQAQMGPYVAAIGVPTGDTYATYTAVSPRIDGTITQQFLKRGLESAGWLSPSSYDGSIFVPGGSTPKITKYTVDDQGRMVEGQTINFSGVGLENVDQGPIIGETMISPTKAYAIDDKNRRIVVWNPSTMELTGKVIDFAAAAKKPTEAQPEYALQLFHAPGFVKTRGNRTFMPIRWTNWTAETPDKIIWRSAGLLVFDNEKDEFVHLLQDERLIDRSHAQSTSLARKCFGARAGARAVGCGRRALLQLDHALRPRILRELGERRRHRPEGSGTHAIPALDRHHLSGR